jgi:multimeric flavodoxin WrbA
MKIVVINGSPKGKHSITLQYVRFLETRFPRIEFEVLNVALRIKRLEKNRRAFDEVIDTLRSADAVLWSFGLWVLAVSAQLMRFLELVEEREAGEAFRGKYTAALSTSIHYFDHTAHNYVRAVCEDLGMKYVDGLSMDIMDLLDAEMRERLVAFCGELVAAVTTHPATTRHFPQLAFSEFRYEPRSPGSVGRRSTEGQKVLVLADRYEEDSNLGRMIDRFRAAFSDDVELIDLRDVHIQGACIGCMQCGYNYKCQYDDGFADFYNEHVRAADVLVFAGEMRGRYLSSMWKTFYDRAFFWNHTPSLVGKQMAYLVAGPLSQNANLVQILQASSEARQFANHVDMVSDECGDSALLDAQLDALADRLIRLSTKAYVKPPSFLAVGGHKIFRDDVWGRLRPVWQADHRHYRKNGFYDFPQRDVKMRLTRPLMMLATRIPAVRKRYYKELKAAPARNFARLVDGLAKDGGKKRRSLTPH